MNKNFTGLPRAVRRGRVSKGLSFLLTLWGIVVCGAVLNAQTREEAISISGIWGVAAPESGRTPTLVTTETAQYSGTVTWSPQVVGTFEPVTQYTATITLTAKRGYTMQGVAADFFTVEGAISARNNANSGVVTVVFPQTGGAAINIAAIPGVTAPATGKTPVMVITETEQYSGTVEWSPGVSGTFNANTWYTATVTLTAKTGYTLEKVAANFFTVEGATSARNSANSGVVTVNFPPTAAIINTASIPGITAPVTGKIPLTAITGNSQYSGTVEWSPEVSETFDAATQYTATITLTAEKGYTLEGVKANFFKVRGAASVRNNADSGVVTAVFPPTKGKTSVYSEDKKLWSLGASLGTSFTAPLLIGTVHGTIAPFNSLFLELGVDAGTWGIDRDDVSYYSLYPFANFAFFVPFPRTADGRGGGWYVGAGAGYMFANYEFETAGQIEDTTIAMNIVTGFNVFDMFDISYTVRTNIKSTNSKLAFGYVYRFK